MRRQIEMDDLRLLERHDHVAWWGHSSGELDRIAVEAFATGARQHERMLFIGEEPDPRRLARLPGVEAMIDRGDLELASLREVYEDADSFDAEKQLRVFHEVLDDSLARGYSGLRVLADNTPFARGSDAAFASWLEWEYLADRLQAAKPVAGVCFFDVRKVSPDRLADLASVHPLLPDNSVRPPFRSFFDDGVVRVLGSLEALFVDRMQRMLAHLPTGRPCPPLRPTSERARWPRVFAQREPLR